MQSPIVHSSLATQASFLFLKSTDFLTLVPLHFHFRHPGTPPDLYTAIPSHPSGLSLNITSSRGLPRAPMESHFSLPQTPIFLNGTLEMMTTQTPCLSFFQSTHQKLQLWMTFLSTVHLPDWQVSSMWAGIVFTALSPGPKAAPIHGRHSINICKVNEDISLALPCVRCS